MKNAKNINILPCNITEDAFAEMHMPQRSSMSKNQTLNAIDLEGILLEWGIQFSRHVLKKVGLSIIDWLESEVLELNVTTNAVI